ncbi:MAG: class I SAM-dependent methyltransferase [Gemmataceae bacterium]|nr:class I SAM-dependent methyltransferase [Gemmataceae bacterium]MDW8267238.1 class I SAM-dependent methyltransferase [Gemmataceae bacterium]
MAARTWKLPPGVTAGVWHYAHDPDLARGYDASLADSPLLTWDLEFAEKHLCRPGRLIDLGCGTGRLLIPFAQRGFWVLGVDLSAEMLRVAADKAQAAGVHVHLLRANLVQLEAITDGAFDYAACLFNTLGMIDGPANRQRVLDHAYRLLRPGGIFIGHVHNRWFNLWDPQGRRWVLRNLVRSALGLEEGGDVAMPVHQGIAGLTLHVFTRREMVRLLLRAGFRLIEIKPLGLRPDGRLPWPRCFGWLRAYGYLIAARR